MKKGLNEMTIKKMNYETKINQKIDEYINEFRTKTKYDINSLIRIIEEIRSYREKIFQLKCQVKDLNKVYEKLGMWNFFGGCKNEELFPHAKLEEKGEYLSTKDDAYAADEKRLYFLIYQYYERLIAGLEQGLIEEKAEHYSSPKEPNSNEEDVIELQ